MSEQEEIHVLVRNLPPEVVEDDLLDAFENLGFDLDVSIVRDGNPDKVTAVVAFEGMTRSAAEKLADHINGMPWRDRYLQAYVPLFFK